MRRKAAEDIFLIASIASLWPYILGLRARWYLACLGGVLIALAVMAATRMRAVLARLGARGPGGTQGAG